MKKTKNLYQKVFSLIIILTISLLYKNDSLSSISNIFGDYFFTNTGIINPNIYILGMDEKTLAKFGPFQSWTREIFADAINILNSDENFKPKVIALDILFSGETNEKADQKLAYAADKGKNVVVASSLLFSKNLSNNNEIETNLLMEEKPFDLLLKYVDYGYINAELDKDRVARHTKPKLNIDNKIFDSFSLAIYKKFTSDNLDHNIIPNNRVYINYSGNAGDYYGSEGMGFSFSDIFEEDFDPSFFSDSIVLIGPYAPGFMDAYFTPINKQSQMYGVEIQANILNMMLENDYKNEIPFKIQFPIFLTLGILFFIIFKNLDIRISTAILIISIIINIFLGKIFFDMGYILNLFYYFFLILTLYVFFIGSHVVAEKLEKDKIRSVLTKYVDKQLVEKLIESKDLEKQKMGVKKDIAVLFVDIRGFTTFSHKLKDNPEKVVEILNEYLELTSTAVFKNGGSIDKFIGDATMALFNAFSYQDDYVFQAVKAAEDIVKGAFELNKKLVKKYGAEVGFGIGVHCGEALVGNIGPEFRKDYTAIGDTVNMAARLESMAKSSQILLSTDLIERLNNRIKVENLGEYSIKGRGVTEVYELVSINN